MVGKNRNDIVDFSTYCHNSGRAIHLGWSALFNEMGIMAERTGEANDSFFKSKRIDQLLERLKKGIKCCEIKVTQYRRPL